MSSILFKILQVWIKSPRKRRYRYHLILLSYVHSLIISTRSLVSDYQHLCFSLQEKYLLTLKLHLNLRHLTYLFVCPRMVRTTALLREEWNWVLRPQPLHLSTRYTLNPFTASCENVMTLSVPGIPAYCEKFPHYSQLNFWSTESIFNPFSVFLKTLNTLCVCLQYKHPRSIKRVIRSDKPVTLLLLLWLHKCDFGAVFESHNCDFGSERVNAHTPFVALLTTLSADRSPNSILLTGTRRALLALGVGLGRVVRKVRQHPDDHEFESQQWQWIYFPFWFAVDCERW
jgi:hypothetical protein